MNDVPAVLPTTRGLPSRLMRHYGGNPRGRSVLKIAGVYVTMDEPDANLIQTATEYYAGGHTYFVTDAVADALAAAGYTVDVAGGYEQGYAGGY